MHWVKGVQSVKRISWWGWLMVGMVACLAGIWWFSLPDPLFTDPEATVLLDREGKLLGARLAGDQQWRFPAGEEVPERFREAILTFEDRYFYYHPGINPVALFRALQLNYQHGEIVSGGSTISMQVIRLARKNRPRTYLEKIRELFLALRLECRYSKREILEIYAAHAPFGGNVVGLEAAAWRYFGTAPEQLSWAQTVTLAVLPNAPALIFPGRNPAALEIKRNRLLEELCHRGIMDTMTLLLAKAEPLPGWPLPIPSEAPHLLDRAGKEKLTGTRILTTLDRRLQQQSADILTRHSASLRANNIFNAAALILDVESGEALAYVGNLPDDGLKEHGHAVDIVRSYRSTGSLLKPLLYGAMLDDGLLLPVTLVPDIPTQMGGFMPENYNRTYDGAVQARQALARSLNVPFVKMLQVYGYERFYGLLRRLGMHSLNQPSGHYGLSLILGGAESSLWEMAGIYASLARVLNRHERHPGRYDKRDIHPPSWRIPDIQKKKDNLPWKDPEGGERLLNGSDAALMDAGALWLMVEAMTEVVRPEEQAHWQLFSSSRKIAWKTGTSFGNRDAWAIGITPGYVVAVWAGNATGEGRPGLTGLGMAAPVLFDLVDMLPATGWFAPPVQALDTISVCRYSGFRNGPDCEETDTMVVPLRGKESGVCPWHHRIHLDVTGTFQVNASCYPVGDICHRSWFILPPAMAFYYSRKNPAYQSPPPWFPACEPAGGQPAIGIIYPGDHSHIYIPVDLDGRPGAAVFKAAHRDPEGILFWHLDNRFLGSTRQLHQMDLSPGQGWHTLTLVDQYGESVSIRFHVI